MSKAKQKVEELVEEVGTMERTAMNSVPAYYIISAEDIGKLDGLILTLVSADREGVLDAKAGLFKIVTLLREVVKKG